MEAFHRQNQVLYVENVALNEIADQFGTPCYVYSRAAIENAYAAYADALGEGNGRICYAVKANSNLAVLQVLVNLGASFDIVSEGELRRVIMAGGKPEDIIFSGVGKTREEMLYALELGIHCFNVESEAELIVLSQLAVGSGHVAPISLRVNPDVDAQTHPYISTGLKENKFGIAIDRAGEVYRRAVNLPGISVIGVDCHIGSQLTDSQPFIDALDRLLALVDKLHEDQIPIEHLDLGGGIGVRYQHEETPNIGAYIAKVKEKMGNRGLSLAFEPGRSIVANAGVLLMEVIYVKPTEHKNFAIVDAAMNDNIRPALYQAWQDVQRLDDSALETDAKDWDIVGPVCETGDFLAKDRHMPLEAGQRLALMSSGAYGFVMSSNYNSRKRIAEVLVDKNQIHLVRERERFEDIVRGEHLLTGGAGVKGAASQSLRSGT